MLLSGQLPVGYEADDYASGDDSDAGAAAPGPPRGDPDARGAGGPEAPEPAGGGGSGAGSGEEPEDDAALARRLHEAEQRELYRRMLEMSGYHQAAQQGARCGRASLSAAQE